jgi:peptidoglycan-N-acetylglucosamine deacetylase
VPPARFVFWAATLGGILFTVRAVVRAPPPLWLAALLVLLYLAIMLSGVLVLRLQMFSDAVISGPEGSRGVALTFDDGPDPKHTRAVLDVLDRAGAKGTFFVIGEKAERHADVVREIVLRGHTVGVHGFGHDRLFSLRGPRRVRADLERAVASLQEITGERPWLFRPPIGHTNPTIARIAEQLDLTTVGWSVRGRDGLPGARPEDVVLRVKRGLEDGAIVLLHDAAERGDRRPAALDALPQILDAIAAKNLTVVPLTELVT